MPTVFHIASEAEWLAARADGTYRRSTRGRTLDDVGFVHCADAEQVTRVADALYADASEPLVVLAVDTEGVGADIVYENLEGGVERFPHVYGPIPVSAVISATPLERRPSGGFVFEPER